MRKLLLLFLIASTSCNRIHGWFPGWDDEPKISGAQPLKGCNKDLIVHYKNNCSKQLIMYFIEVDPGTIINCESLNVFGAISTNETKAITIHKGKLGYFVFAVDTEGKCKTDHRKAEAWINCEQSASNEANFDVCH